MSDIFDSVEAEDYSSIYGEDLNEGYEDIYGMEYAGESDYNDLDSAEARRSPYMQRVVAARRKNQLARRKNALAQARTRPSYPAVPQRPAIAAQVNHDLQRTRAGIEKVDLENKVQTDLFGGALRNQRDRISRNEYALAASTLMDELKKQFPDLFAGEFGTLLPFASLLLLKPDGKGKSGIERYLNDPRFVFPALALGLKLFKQSRAQDVLVVVKPDNVKLSLATQKTITLIARDRNGMPFPPGKVTWKSGDPTKISVSNTGEVKSDTATGTFLIEAVVTQDGKEFSGLAVVQFDP